MDHWNNVTINEGIKSSDKLLVWIFQFLGNEIQVIPSRIGEQA